MTILDNARQWAQWSQAEAERIVEVAVAASLHGSPQWDALLREAGVDPLPQAERQRHATVGPPRSSGPSPIEVRRALEALRARAHQAAADLDAAQQSFHDPTERAIDDLKRAADRLVNENLRHYISRVRPKISTSSIFANAMASSLRRRAGSAGDSGPGTSTLCCDCCGAPRMKDAASPVCEFCGEARR